MPLQRGDTFIIHSDGPVLSQICNAIQDAVIATPSKTLRAEDAWFNLSTILTA